MVSPLKKYSGSTFGGLGSQRCRVTAFASKMAQIGPPPFNLLEFPLYPIAALKKSYPPSSSFQNLRPAWLTRMTFCQSTPVRPDARTRSNIGLSAGQYKLL